MSETIIKFTVVVSAFIMLIFYAKRKNTISSALCGMSGGGAILLLLHFFGGYIGFSPPVSLFNTAVSLALGIPGVIIIAAVNLMK